ncbi:hypothetical protein MU582_16765 [Nocardioidaceae bacterium SCSIO 66511]|nr:hypothetical protein MU582_16765 [Nocardioidaceae bacterium SCSIO 66511]
MAHFIIWGDVLRAAYAIVHLQADETAAQLKYRDSETGRRRVDDRSERGVHA